MSSDDNDTLLLIKIFWIKEQREWLYTKPMWFASSCLQHFDSVTELRSWSLGTAEAQPGSEADSYFCIKLLSQVCTGVLNNWDGHQTYGHSTMHQWLAVMLKIQSILLTKGLFITWLKLRLQSSQRQLFSFWDKIIASF